MNIKELLQNKQSLLFCGAGISLAPPAGLPNWKSMRNYTLEAIAGESPFLQKYLPILQELETIRVKNQVYLSPEKVASDISHYCRGYFECFRTLERGQPNENHKCIAQLAKNGYLQYIVTTNFDIFIEKALRKENIQYKVYKTDKQFSSFHFKKNRNFVHIFKLHGCLSEPNTIISTVEQQQKGLNFHKKEVLKKLQQKLSVIFWGYSGADLNVDMDYLGLISMQDSGKGFVWNFFEEDLTKNIAYSYVQEIVNLYDKRASIVYDALPKIFSDVVSFSFEAKQKNFEDWQKQKDAQLQQDLLNWGKSDIQNREYVRYKIFASLLRLIKKTDSALKCYEKCAQIVECDKDYAQLSITWNKMGSIYLHEKCYPKAVEYTQKAIDLDRKLLNKRRLIISIKNMVKVLEKQENRKEISKLKREISLLRKKL